MINWGMQKNKSTVWNPNFKTLIVHKTSSMETHKNKKKKSKAELKAEQQAVKGK